MHIAVEGIFLKKIDFELILENIPKDIEDGLSYGLDVNCHSHFTPERDRLVQIIDFDVAHGVDKAPFRFKFSIQAQYRSEGEGKPTLEEFSKYNAPAYVVPYARELIANITSRISIIPTLVIPPINIFELIEAQKQSLEEVANEPANGLLLEDDPQDD